MKGILSALQRLWARLFRRTTNYTSATVEDLPDKLESDIVYIAGENGHLWYAAFLCPCGCGETIQLGLMEGQRPKWSVIVHENGTVTLHPSVWRTVGCKSHFFLKRGRISWVSLYADEAGLQHNSTCTPSS